MTPYRVVLTRVFTRSTFRMTRSSIPTILPATIVALALVFGTLLPTSAQQSTPQATPPQEFGPSFVIHPVDGMDGDFFTVEAEAGTTVDLTVVLGNADDEPLELRTYANDVIPVPNGGFAVATHEQIPTGTATWLDYAPEVMSFEPGKGIERTFQLSIPADTTPGQHIAGLVLETAEPLDIEGTTLFNQIVRKAIAVFIIVPGPEQPAFSIDAPEIMQSRQGSSINANVVNSGNVLVKPAGTLELVDSTGEVAYSSPVSMGSVYAGTTAPLSLRLGPDVPAGTYTVRIHLTDDATGTTASLDGDAVDLMPADAPSVALSLDATVAMSPDVSNPVFAQIDTSITNDGPAIPDAQILVDVARNGEIVETFVLDPGLTLQPGVTTVSQRYVAPTGWTAGTWSFEVRLVLIDPVSGATTSVATVSTDPPIEIGG